MRKTGKRRSARRNVFFITLSFLLVGGLAVLARVHQSMQDFLPPESEEAKAFRLDRERNAFYALEKAMALLPPPPPPVQMAADPATGRMRAGAAYEPPEGTLANLVWVMRPDDEVLFQYIRDCKPALDEARRALELGDLMVPPPPPVKEGEQQISSYGLLRQLFSHFRAFVRLHAASPGPSEEDSALFRDLLRLEYLINRDVGIKLYVAEDLVPILKRMPARELRQTIDWLALFRRQIEPPYRLAEGALRDFMAHREDVDWKYILNHPGQTTVYLAHRARDKALLRRHYKNYIAAAGVELYRLREFEREHATLANLRFADNLMGYEMCSRVYSGRLAEHDGLTLAAAVELYRREHQEYPEWLDQVAQYVASMPVDPFSGKPFNYARIGDDYTLFSKEPGGNGEVIIYPQPKKPDVVPPAVRPVGDPFTRLKSKRGTG